jgi:DNA mismatch endonuclease (patch repair protein)
VDRDGRREIAEVARRALQGRGRAQSAMPQFRKPSPERSAVMRAVKSRDTGPEIAVRAMLWAIAPGYRLCRADLPGKPDIAYSRRKLAIFVHGCFWHGHDCPRGARMPKSNADYWRAKIARNRARDAAATAALDGMGWRALIIYECELKDSAALRARLGAEFA